jgi:lysophospholipase L1-like esterase
MSGNGSSSSGAWSGQQSQAALLHALSDDQLLSALTAAAKKKDRSHTTHVAEHMPLLVAGAPGDIKLLMLGDSLFERCAPDERVSRAKGHTGSHTKLAKALFPYVFNAGVGGDRIPNVLYRMIIGLLKALHDRRVSNAILHVGTNDLQRIDQALTSAKADVLLDKFIRHYGFMVAALQKACPGVNILVTGLMFRRDIAGHRIKEVNGSLEQLVAEFAASGLHDSTKGKIEFMQPIAIGEDDLVDNVHLRKDTYTRFGQALYDAVKDLDDTFKL